MATKRASRATPPPLRSAAIRRSFPAHLTGFLTPSSRDSYTRSMAELARTLPISREDDDVPGFPVLQRWIEHPDGRRELLERPLTPEDFLNPQPEDTMSQGEPHATVRRQLADLLDRHFKPKALILEDVIHQLGPGLPAPSPDISVILGARPGERSEERRVGKERRDRWSETQHKK